MENNDLKIEEIDQVILILQQLNIPATFDNMTKLLCCHQLLGAIKEKVAKVGAAEVDQNAADRNE